MCECLCWLLFLHVLTVCVAFVQLGGEGGAASSNQTHRNLKMFMRASAVLVLPISISFPSVSLGRPTCTRHLLDLSVSLALSLSLSLSLSPPFPFPYRPYLPVTSLFSLPSSRSLQGLFMYWVTNSLFSTCQILFLKIPKVKQFFGIPKIVRPPEQS